MHIIGAGGHAKVVIETLALNNEPIEGVWDDAVKPVFFSIYKIQGTIGDFKIQVSNPKIIVAIGNNKVRKDIIEELNTEFGIAVHPMATISSSATLLEGSVVMANVTVNADAYIGRHVILNTNASIDHDCNIGDFVHISPQAGLAGAVEVGEGTNIGIGACVIQGVRIGKWVTIGAGSVIIKDVPDYAVVVGNPGRIIKYNI